MWNVPGGIYTNPANLPGLGFAAGATPTNCPLSGVPFDLPFFNMLQDVMPDNNTSNESALKHFLIIQIIEG